MNTPILAFGLALGVFGTLSAAEPASATTSATSGDIKEIKAYCLD